MDMAALSPEQAAGQRLMVGFDGIEFNPEIAEAVRMDPADDPDLDGTVTETVQPGFRLGDHVIRAARVAVGRSR